MKIRRTRWASEKLLFSLNRLLSSPHVYNHPMGDGGASLQLLHSTITGIQMNGRKTLQSDLSMGWKFTMKHKSTHMFIYTHLTIKICWFLISNKNRFDTLTQSKSVALFCCPIKTCLWTPCSFTVRKADERTVFLQTYTNSHITGRQANWCRSLKKHPPTESTCL